MTLAITPTDEQQAVIDYPSSLVVIARPGSGKTFVLSDKIRTILPALSSHQGAIAISYTNKASDELKRRSRRDGIDVKSSFFGTIDRFCDNEIIMPFLPHLWGRPGQDISIVRIRDLSEDAQEQFASIKANQVNSEVLQEHLETVKSYFLRGQLLLETNGALALYVVSNSGACRTYIQSRYTHVFIDEYQDSGQEQHELFLELRKLGLTAIAVGDANQSIFGFSGKSPEYLFALAANDEFRSFSISYNHRCHPSIINYSLRLLDKHSEKIRSDNTRVYMAHRPGTVSEIARWIGRELPKICGIFDVASYADIGILVRSVRTGIIVDQVLAVQHRFFNATPLEEDFSLWAKLFARLLTYHFDDRLTAQEIINEFGSNRLNSQEIRTCRRHIKGLSVPDLPSIDEFVDVARFLLPNAESERAVELLSQTLRDDDCLLLFQPAKDDEVQVMTLHKAKGMEFDVVFHLDLYEWVLPAKRPGPGNDWDNSSYSNWEQDLNLHYVGVTRARKCCILCSSTKRINSSGKERNGAPSEFLSLNGVSQLRAETDGIL